MITTLVRTLAIFVVLAQCAFGQNLLLVGGSVVDGSGRARVRNNVRVRDGRITEIGALRAARGETVVDVTGMIVAPGFIDLHNHSTTVLEDNLDAASQIAQGITTIVVGMDGEGPFEVEGFMARFDETPPTLNIAAFTGHSTVRREVLGQDAGRPATPEEITRMEELVEMGMREGAFGLSTSLSSGPSSFAASGELLALARVVARYGGSLVCEVRDYGDSVTQAIREVVDIARQAKIPLQISHLKLTGAAMHGKAAQVLAELDRARMQGVDVIADINGYSEEDGGAASEKDVRDFVRHASVVIASDGRIGDSHPRGAGAFPRVFSKLVATDKALTVEAAIRKMTAAPAGRLSLRGRGVIQRNAVADIVVFDPAKIKDVANPEQPGALAEGVKYVFVNGVMVLKDGVVTDARPGIGIR